MQSKMTMARTVLILVVVALASGDQTTNPYFRSYTTTKMGSRSITGTSETIRVFGTDYNITVHRGIPYAEPPIHQLRFKPPVAKTVPDGYKAIKFGDACWRWPARLCSNNTLITDPMYHTEQSEDCLYLNIYSPGDASPTNLKAVLVFFQMCGGWFMADGQQHNGMVLAARGDVIVVTFNYRVGAFGYLSTGVKGTGANYGLYDQLEVLRWVQKNIGYFGGDKDRVTISGMQPGGIDVTLHGWVNRKAVGLFKRVAVTSRTASSSMPQALGLVDKPAKFANMFAKFTGCYKKDITDYKETERVFECLRNQPPGILNEASRKVEIESSNAYNPLMLVWGPSVDGELITFHPSLFYGSINKFLYRAPENTDLLVGLRLVDGGCFDMVLEARRRFYAAAKLERFAQGLTAKILKTNLLIRLFLAFDNTAAIAKAAYHEYFDDLPPDEAFSDPKRKERFVQLVHDMLSYSGMVGHARIHASRNKGKTFMYHFTQKDDTKFDGTTLPRSHEKPYMLGDIALVALSREVKPNVTMDPKEKVTNLDRDMMYAMIDYFANFIKFGNPNGNPKQATPPQPNPRWPTFTNEDQAYMDIGSNSASLKLIPKKNLREKQVAFWLNVVPYIMRNPKVCPAAACPTCPTVLGRFIGRLGITVVQARAVIAIVVLGTIIFGIIVLVVSILLCKTSQALKKMRVGDPSFSTL